MLRLPKSPCEITNGAEGRELAKEDKAEQPDEADREDVGRDDGAVRLWPSALPLSRRSERKKSRLIGVWIKVR